MHFSVTFTHALPVLFLHAIVMCNFCCLYLGTLNFVWRWIMIIPKNCVWSIISKAAVEVMDEQLNLIINCNISTYVNNNNKCDPSGFSYIIVCFVPFVLFLPSIEPVLVSYCILLHDTGWRIFFFTKLSVTFFPMTHVWQRYYNESSVKLNTIFKCTYHSFTCTSWPRDDSNDCSLASAF
jgi:hypothetical protein